MRVLITGGAGFVGSSLARYLKSSFPSASVVAFDNLKRRGSELNLRSFREVGVEFVHGDVRSRTDLEELGGEFDTLIDASAEPSVHAGSEGRPHYVVEANLMGTFNCLAFARERKSRFVLLSTSRVYSIEPLRGLRLIETPSRFEIAADQVTPGVTSLGISETFPTSLARSFYGASKLGAEQIVQEFAFTYGLPALILRCGVIAGPGQFGKPDQGVFTMWLAHHYFGKPLTYTGFGGTGKQVRDLLHVQDLCELIGSALRPETGFRDAFSGGVFNTGGGAERAVSLREFTEQCRMIVGRTVSISCAPETLDSDVPVYVSDCTKLFESGPWRPVRTVEMLASDIYSWIRANEATLRPLFT